MKKRQTTYRLGLLTIILFFAFQATAQSNLEQLFVNPPDYAKPRGYWIWGHGNYDYSTIKRELKAFKEMGLGGVDIFDMGIADPYDIIPDGNPFLGEKMLDGIAFALQEANKLDLKMGFSVSNGWNAGGDWTAPDEMLMQLLFWQDTLKGPVKIEEVGFPELPKIFKKPYGTFELFPQLNDEGFPEFYEDVSLLAYPLSADNKIADTEKVLFFNVDDLKGNKIKLDLPEGNWVLTRAVVSPLGQKMWMRSSNSNGFIMDHYSKKATKNHFEHIVGKLEERLGDLGESSLERLYLCSFEAEDYIIWSPELKEEFFAQHGYEPDVYMPVFTGQKVLDENTTKRFLHDYRSTVSEMFVNYHYRQASQICRDHGLLLASESGGPGPPLHYVPTEDLKALGAVDIMRGEFWNMPQRWKDKKGRDLLQVVKNIASAAHIYGHKVVEMESFTSQTKHWQEAPYDLKKIADQAFCQGMTRVIYHTMPHSPPEAGVPGWSYQAGTHIHPKMTWWDMSKPFHTYLARCSALLMQGNFVADVAFYYGSDIPNFAIGSKYPREGLGEGYDYDDLNTEILLQTEKVENGKIILPSGMQYHVLVLPDSAVMELRVLKKVEELLQKGATIIGPKPKFVYGLNQFEAQEVELKKIADNIWGKSSAKRKRKKNYGKGTIITGYTAREILEEKGIFQDFNYKVASNQSAPLIDYIHRSTGEEEIYFIRNMDTLALIANLNFRIPQNMKPAIWDPVSGEISQPAIFRFHEKGLEMPLKLEGLQSYFIVFSKTNESLSFINKITKNGEILFPAETMEDFDFSAKFQENQAIVFQTSLPGEYELIRNNGAVEKENFSTAPQIKILENSWQVHFPYGWGFDPVQQFDELMDWTAHPNSALKIFSGKASYKTSFEVEDEFLELKSNYFLDLGELGDVATVYLNGKEVGTSIFPPHQLNIDGIIKSGLNYLEVEVANTWLNQLIGESKKPLDEQRTRSNLGNTNGERPWSNYSPKRSGLLGPVRIISRPFMEFPRE
ncbi:glycosyl hydrolase [Flexithrix dorotheae]|uniref:glycosyl hydrolase n=1 Tax=Flexithrix dorotheae TaxID=70993 RepID=UPI00035C95A0|nr:glycosyl hydrolase [Flexithrix dorotheae]